MTGGASESVPSAAGDDRSGNELLRVEVAHLRGQLEVLQQRISAQDAADEHHRVELEMARADAASARAEQRDAQVRVEEWRRLVAESRERLAAAERQWDQAEAERAAVIAALGRRARKQLSRAES